MHKILKEIGMKEWKAPPSVGIKVEEFREHFEKVSEKRYEVDLAVIGGVIERLEVCSPDMLTAVLDFRLLYIQSLV